MLQKKMETEEQTKLWFFLDHVILKTLPWFRRTDQERVIWNNNIWSANQQLFAKRAEIS